MPCLRRSDRPTLPSLKALGLPTTSNAPKDTIHDHLMLNDISPSTVFINDPFSVKPCHRIHRSSSSSSSLSSLSSASTSSSSTLASRSPSPSPPYISNSHCAPCGALPPPTPLKAPFPACSPYPSPPPPAISLSSREELRFIPSSLEDAQALIVVSPPPPTSAGKTTMTSPNKGSALLVMGSSLHQLRRDPSKIPRGTRFHPYRIMRCSIFTTNSKAKRTSPSCLHPAV